MFNQESQNLPDSATLQVENTSDGEELKRDGSERHSRRRFHKVNPRGERELITDGQGPVGSPTVSYQHFIICLTGTSAESALII